jgi:hypothetical protein
MQSSHEKFTTGGFYGHLLRRLIHLFCGPLLCWLYYFHSAALLQWLDLSSAELVIALFSLTAVVEAARIHLAIVPIGMRDFEDRQISSATWALFGFYIVFLFLNKPNYAVPIVFSLALVDPIIGELKRVASKRATYYSGAIVALLIWLGFSWYFQFPAWLAVLMAPITVLSEWCAKRHLDDNFTMLFIPLIVVLLVRSC